MASAIVHLAVMKLASERLGISDERFLSGGILPDFAGRDNSHYRVQNPETGKKTIELFIASEALFGSAGEPEPEAMGFYLHLVQDRLFCRFLIEECGYTISTENTRKLYHDYSLLNRYVIDRYGLRPLSEEALSRENSFLRRKFRIDGPALCRSLREYFSAEEVTGTPFFLTEEAADRYIGMAAELSVKEYEAVKKGCPPYDKMPYYWKRSE